MANNFVITDIEYGHVIDIYLSESDAKKYCDRKNNNRAKKGLCPKYVFHEPGEVIKGLIEKQWYDLQPLNKNNS